MRSLQIILLAPPLDLTPCFINRSEPMLVQTFLPASPLFHDEHRAGREPLEVRVSRTHDGSYRIEEHRPDEGTTAIRVESRLSDRYTHFWKRGRLIPRAAPAP